jgi:hypothetical protein
MGAFGGCLEGDPFRYLYSLKPFVDLFALTEESVLKRVVVSPLSCNRVQTFKSTFSEPNWNCLIEFKTIYVLKYRFNLCLDPIQQAHTSTNFKVLECQLASLLSKTEVNIPSYLKR